MERKFYRIRYPAGCRPLIWMGGDKYPVLDLSEKGIRFQSTRDDRSSEGRSIKAKVQFSDGEYVEIEGRLIRQDNGEKVLCLNNSIPLKRIFDEQRMIIREFNGEM